MIKLMAENGWVAKDEYGIQYPWYTSGMLDVLDKMDLKGKRIFEYGVGRSTIWYRSKWAIVYGVDSNNEWATLTNTTFTENEAEYLLAPIIRTPIDDCVFDLVIIDGLYRDDCTEYALQALKPGGMLIIDNWMQPSVEPNDWTKTLELTKGMKSEVFAQEGHEDWKTIYFIKP